MNQSAYDFRTIEQPRTSSRAEQLFKAAASAFSSLTRPSKLEIQQFEELACALFAAVSPEARRYVAATIASNAFAPKAVLMRLAREPAAICAPVLALSKSFTPGDLVGLIARHGVDHARVISKRGDLDPAIRALLNLMVKDNNPPTAVTPVPVREGAIPAGTDAETVRSALRTAMAANPERPVLPVRIAEPVPAAGVRLISMAISGNRDFFQTALADALGISFRVAGEIADDAGHAGLLMALKGLKLDTGEAFLITSAVYPGHFASTHSVKHFCDRFERLTLEAAKDRIADWRAQSTEVPDQARKNADAIKTVKAAPLASFSQSINDVGTWQRLKAS